MISTIQDRSSVPVYRLYVVE